MNAHTHQLDKFMLFYSKNSVSGGVCIPVKKWQSENRRDTQPHADRECARALLRTVVPKTLRS